MSLPIVNLSNLTFLIPVLKDSEDRAWNLQCCLHYLDTTLQTNVSICEVTTQDTCVPVSVQFGNLSIEYHEWSPRPDGLMHRTRMLNYLAYKATTPYVCLFDADVIIPENQWERTAKGIELGYKFIWPYHSPTYDIPKGLQPLFMETMDMSMVQHQCVKPRKPHINVGGAIICHRETFLELGGFRDDFISWGSEDEEFHDRLVRLGFPIARVPGNLYHLEHSRGINSGTDNPYRWENRKKHLAMTSFRGEQLNTYCLHLKQIMMAGIIQRDKHGNTP